MAENRSPNSPPLDDGVKRQSRSLERRHVEADQPGPQRLDRLPELKFSRSDADVQIDHRAMPDKVERPAGGFPDLRFARPDIEVQPDHRTRLEGKERPAGRLPEPRRTSLAPPTVEGDWADVADSSVGTTKMIATGFLIIFLFFGIGILWAGFAPISSAAIASGQVSVAGNRKTVQHLEGGIVSEILIKEGDAVVASQPLIKLNDTQPRTTRQALLAQYATALAQEARLQAEMASSDSIDFPDHLDEQRGDVDVAQIIQAQEDIFSSRRTTLENQANGLRQRMVQQEIEIKGLKNQILSSEKQLGLIKKELESVETLVAKGLATRTRLYNLQREEAGLEADIVKHETQIAVTRGGIEEVKGEIADLYATRYEKAAAEMRDVHGDLIALREQLPTAEDSFQRTTIVAPISGRVVNLQVHTVGGVITSGTPILDIVPDNDELVVEAHLDPKDRDVVASGMPAEVRFTAFNQRNSVPVKGRVVWISADGQSDERTGASFYTARVQLVEDPGSALNGASIFPGMKANVMIVTGERTALSYLFGPITRSFTAAFREE